MASSAKDNPATQNTNKHSSTTSFRPEFGDGNDTLREATRPIDDVSAGPLGKRKLFTRHDIPHRLGEIDELPRVPMLLRNKLEDLPSDFWKGFRGKDMPNLQFGPENKRKDMLASFQCLIFKKHEREEGDVLTIGGTLEKLTPENPGIYLDFRLDTQWPRLHFKLKIPDGKSIQMSRFLSDLDWYEEEGYPEIKALRSDEIRFDHAVEEFYDYAGQRERAQLLKSRIDRREVWALDVSFTIFPRVTGLSKQEIDDLLENIDDELWKEYFSVLFSKGKLTFFFNWDPQMFEVFQKFSDYITSLGCLVADEDFGNGWWYRAQLQRNQHMDSENINFENLKDPWWMIEDAWVQLKSDGTIADHGIDANRVGKFSIRDIMPNDATIGFIQRLGLAREVAASRNRLENIAEGNNQKVRIFPSPRFAGQCMAAVFIEGVSAEKKEVAEAGTRIEITVYIPGTATVAGKTVVIEGSAKDELVDLGQTLMVSGHFKDFQSQEVDVHTRYDCRIQYKFDPLPNYRGSAAMQMVNLPPAKNWGPDLPAIVSRREPKVTYPGQSRKQPLTDTQRQGYISQIRNLDPNKFGDSNKAAALAALDPPEGVLRIQGGPGTSKTETILEIVDATVKHLGGKCLVCAPSNDAVQELAARYMARSNRSDFLWFNLTVGSKDSLSNVQTNEDTTMGGTADPNNMETDELARISADLDEFIKENEDADDGDTDPDLAILKALDKKVPEFRDSHLVALEDHSYLPRWVKFVKDQASDDGPHGPRYEAAKFLIQCQGKELDEEDRKRLRVAKSVLRNAFFDRFPVLFMTNNTAAHDVYRKHWRVKQETDVFIDEAGLANLAETVIPLAAHRRTIGKFVLIGDGKKLSPLATAGDINVSHRWLGQSLFERLGGKDKQQVATVILTMQYRMYKDIFEFPQKVLYQEIKTARGDDWNPLQFTIAAFFTAHLGNAWNRKMCMAVDCQRSFDEPVFGTSRRNMGECTMICELIERLCKFAPPAGGEQIKPEHFMVISPYTGQVTALAAELSKRSAPGKDLRQVLNLSDVDYKSIRRALGHQKAIVLESFAVRPQEKGEGSWGFIWERGQLAVGMTRAADLYIQFGNWKAWAQGWENGRLNRIEDKKTWASLIEYNYLQNGTVAFDEWCQTLAPSAPAGPPATPPVFPADTFKNSIKKAKSIGQSRPKVAKRPHDPLARANKRARQEFTSSGYSGGSSSRGGRGAPGSG